MRSALRTARRVGVLVGHGSIVRRAALPRLSGTPLAYPGNRP
ncbi:hypothetical protein LI90_3616 [Carbonactinospora thermoautotrophica]|uniref:Uncharacterized protein n=1 Tax=Carbonactinospora thermoautotrophica TaxID=1469144 RepID=A0A132MXJ9_9ACTN|nr:hypothetical protein LI90_3616 [Carbonactinospora thermoautotrophica]